MATKEEWAAMNSINPHFTFRERTAFLVGYRLAKKADCKHLHVIDTYPQQCGNCGKVLEEVK